MKGFDLFKIKHVIGLIVLSLSSNMSMAIADNVYDPLFSADEILKHRNHKCDSRCHPRRCCRGATGATGAQGPAGPQGPQGPSGAPAPTFTPTFISTADVSVNEPTQAVIDGAAVEFNIVSAASPNFAAPAGNKTFEVPETGAYRISVGMAGVPPELGDSTFNLMREGDPNPLCEFEYTHTGNDILQGMDRIINCTKGDKLSWVYKNSMGAAAGPFLLTPEFPGDGADIAECDFVRLN